MSAVTKIHQEKNQLLYKYWNNLRDNRKAPHRFEIDPIQIAHILPHTFILQHEKSGHYDFRLAGTAICNEFCFELKHSNLLEFWSQNDSEAIHNILSTIEQEATIGCIDFMAYAENGQTVDYEMLILPLYHNNMNISRMLGGLVTKSNPYWLGTSKFESFRVQKIRVFWPDKSRSDTEIHHSSFQKKADALTDMDYKIVTAKDRKFRVYEGGRENS